MSLQSLPTEVLLLIVSLVDREQLKALRLTCQLFLPFATARLFSEIHISPNSHSFDRANNAAASEDLRVLAKHLTYHFGMLEDAYPGFDTFRHEYFSARKPDETRDPSEVTAAVIWSYSCFMQEMDGQKTFEATVNEGEELRHLLQRLPNLESVSTLLDEVDPFTEPQDYIGKRTGMAAVSDYGEGRFAKLFQALGRKKLRAISARSISWFDFQAIQEMSCESMQNRFACLNTLRCLELGVYSSLLDLEDAEAESKTRYFESIKVLGTLLTNVPNVSMLKLDFEELPFESHAEEMLPISRTIFANHWPLLNELKLEAICADYNELMGFLGAHSDTLRLLCIGDIELATHGDSAPSILELFASMRAFLRLDQCRITGNFTNRVDQAWYVNIECDQPNCLRDQLEAYLCGSTLQARGETFMHEKIDQHFELFGALKSDLSRKALAARYERFCDDSWQWCPELLELP